MIISTCPRTSIIAFSELGKRNVVDTFPWDTANSMVGLKEKIQKTGPQDLKILIIAAHPDDIELGCGGLVLKLKEVNPNHKIDALIVTDGCGGTGRDSKTRMKEANEASEVLRLDSIYFGRIRDGQAYGDTLYDLVSSRIIRHSPDVIICHAEIESEHLDHQQISKVVKKLSYDIENINFIQFEVPAPQYESSHFNPNIYVQISPELQKRKEEAIKKHASEINRGSIDITYCRKHNSDRNAENFGDNGCYAEAFYSTDENNLRYLTKYLPFLSLATK